MHKGHTYLEYFLAFMVIAPCGKFTVLHLTWFVPVQRIVEIQEQMLPFCSGITVTLSISSFHQFQKTIHFSMINSPG